ncbi:MAG: DUF4342 domain-containing protein [Clostridia bacterium]|nr:DUF4342 domain-containing protein [Clostridia bacterium]
MDEKTLKQQAQQIVDKVKALVKDGGASRVILKRNGEVLLNLSLNTGVIGAVIGLTAAPFTVLTAALVAFGLDCELEIEKKDGTTVNLNETKAGVKLEDLRDSAINMAKGIFDSPTDASPDDTSAEDTPAEDTPADDADDETVNADGDDEETDAD